MLLSQDRNQIRTQFVTRGVSITTGI